MVNPVANKVSDQGNKGCSAHCDCDERFWSNVGITGA